MRPSGIFYLVGRLDRLLRRNLGAALAEQGLTVHQYTALAMLEAHDSLSNAELAQRSFVTPQAANEMVQAMEARGWVDRAPDPDHGRIIRLRLTRTGRSALAAGHAAASTLEQAMLAPLDADARRALRASLRDCSSALERVS